ncbi:hypothetical protein RB195_012123 [Necator americanus]
MITRHTKALLFAILILIALTSFTSDYMKLVNRISTNTIMRNSYEEQKTVKTLDSGFVEFQQPTISTLKQRKYIQPAPVSDKWIVVTSINYPSKDVKRLASLKNWNLVVVADRKTPPNWNYKGVHFLSMEYQESLGFRLSTVSPENSYTRKNIGYLYAIKNGAKWIYDTDDDNKPYGRGLEQFDYKENISGLCYQRSTKSNSTGDKLFNPYRFFGNPGMWPRGFPLEHLRDHTNGENRLCFCDSMRAPAVQQGLVHKDPDVDAIYRLLHADKENGLNERFNEFASPIVLNSGTYSPWNSQNTLFHKNAFFTLFLPVSVAFRVTDIWRSYFAQKLLHLIGERVAFYPVNAIQFRNAHDYLADFKQEIDVYTKSGKLIEFIEKWKCYSNNIESCTVELAEELGRNNFWQRRDGLMMKLWIDDLRSIGYEFPKMVAENVDDNNCWGTTDNKQSTCFPAHLELETDIPLNHNEKAMERMKKKLEYAEELHDWCREVEPGGVFKSFSNDFLAKKHSHHRSLVANLGKVLIIVTDQRGAGIGILQRLYQPYFAVLIFCGNRDFVSSGSKYASMNTTKPLNFISVDGAVGLLATKCLVRVSQMKLQNVTGYYVMSEALTIQLWIWHDPKKVLFPAQNRKLNQVLWINREGAPTGETAYKLITEKYKNDEAVQKMWNEYQQGLSANNGPQQSASSHIQSNSGYATNRFIYIPSQKIDYFSQLMQIFDEAKLPASFAIAKFLDTVEVEELPSIANIFVGEKYYTKSLVVENPMQFRELSRMDVKNRFCTRIVATFKKILLDDW